MDPTALLSGILTSGPTPNTEDHRLFRLHCAKAEAGLLLEQFTGDEAVSAPFRFVLDLLSERADLTLRDFLGMPMAVSLRTAAGGERWFHGHVTAFRHTGTDGGFARYQAILGPWTDFLSHRRNCRLFQNLDLAGILRELLKPYGSLAQVEYPTASFPPLPLCVQYQESDAQFLARLLEAHGVHYTYRFQADGHVLVLADDSRTAPPLPGRPALSYNVLPGAATEDTISHWDIVHRLTATAHATRTFDFKNPRAPQDTAARTGLDPAPRPELEHYEPGGSFAYPDLEAGAGLARRRLEEHDLRAATCTGVSNVRELACGHSFELLDHYRDAASAHDRLYFLTRIHHSGSNNHLAHDTPADYHNEFECVPRSARYRPPLATARPIIHGPQTAIVVGPKGEEIFCDEHGRVRIQFHWDRDGKSDQDSSCWVRVSTPMAGARFGFIAVPRIGQEVVVEFLDGDPDRPLITGVVYNQDQPPPWDLPGNRTQSGILTRSSKEGVYENANALRFEDRKGEEEVWLHAEKDQRIEVEHDESTTVGHDRSERVGNDETIAIGNDRNETVGNDESVRVDGHQRLSVGKTQDILVGISKNEHVLAASNEQVGGVRTLTVGAAYAVSVGAGKNEAVALGSFEEVGARKDTHVGKSYHIEVAELLEITVGQSKLTMAADGTITLAGVNLHLTGSTMVKALGQVIDLNP